MKLSCNSLRVIALVLGVCTGRFAAAGNLVYFHDTGAGGSPRELYSFDPSTSLSTLRATMTGAQRFFSLEKRPSNDAIYAIEQGTGALYTIDVDTGVATFIASTGLASIGDIAFDPTSGVLYGLGRNFPFSLYTINPSTGASILVGNIGHEVRTGLACSGTGQLYAAELNGVLWKVD